MNRMRLPEVRRFKPEEESMPTMLESLHIDEAKLNKFMAHALEDMGAAMNTGLVIIGDKLGLYKAMAGKGAMTAAELAAATGTDAR